MPINFDLSKYAYNTIFIETGTYTGDGVKAALKSGFKHIYSIELDKDRFDKCTRKFRGNDNVTIIHGDSSVQLALLMEKITEPVTFWLDAHYCGDGAEIGEKWCPLKEEFDAIHSHAIKTHTILIDDWRCMNNTHVDYTWQKQTTKGSMDTVDDKGGKDVGFLGKNNCLTRIREINANYKFTYEKGFVEDDVLCCTI